MEPQCEVDIQPSSKVLSFTYSPILGGTENSITIANNSSTCICYKILTNRIDCYVVCPTSKIIKPSEKEKISIKLNRIQCADSSLFKLLWCRFDQSKYKDDIDMAIQENKPSINELLFTVDIKEELKASIFSCVGALLEKEQFLR